MKVSVVIPAHNEAPNLKGLLAEIGTALEGRDFEVIVVNDGSTDDTSELLAAEARTLPYRLRHIRHRTPSGQSLAVRTGVYAAEGDIIATIDGDGQNDPKYLPDLVDALVAAGPDVGLVSGRRIGRKASAGKRMASKFANRLRRAVLQDEALDSGCGLKAARAELFRRVPFFNGTHRFLPALVAQEGYRTIHCDVADRERRHGASHYGIIDRGLRGWVDLMGVAWLRKRRARIPRPEDIEHV